MTTASTANPSPPPAGKTTAAAEDDVAAGMGYVENRREDAAAATTADAPSASAPTTEATPAPANDNAKNEDDDDDEDARCPICAFVGAGPCAEPHRAWSSCRKQHKEDFVDACKPKFVEFFRCMTSTPESREYHAPLLRAFGAPPEVLGGEGGEEEREKGEEAEAGAGEEARASGDGKT